jgi:hypothetical protein
MANPAMDKSPTIEPPQINNAASSKKVRRMFGLDLDDWNVAMVVFLAIAAAAATSVGVSQFIIIKLQKSAEVEAKKEFDLYKISAAADVSSARSDANAKIVVAREEARVAIEQAQAEIAKSNARSDEANARALEAKLELEKFKAPRILTREAQERIAAKLKLFSDTVFDIGIGPMGDPEPLYLSRSIHSALFAAGWKAIDWTGGGQTYTESPMPSLGLTMVSNVIVDVHPDWWPKFRPAAEALAGALNAEGIDAIADSRPTSIKNGAIHVRIGRKL